MRRFLILLGMAAVAAFFVPAVSASHPSGATFNRAFTWMQPSIDTPGNIGAYNDTGCQWNDQDELFDTAYGKLSAGQSVSVTECIVTDMCSDGSCPHQVAWDTTGNVTATVSDDRGDLWAGAQGCFADPLWPQTVFPPIDGTGGVGYVTHYTLTVTANKTAQIYAGFDLASSHSEGEYGYTRQLWNVPCPN